MIKAIFENIGPIQKAELELGDLTIIAGQNNTGKTYLVHTLYSFLKFLQDTASRTGRPLGHVTTYKKMAILETLLCAGEPASMDIAEFNRLMDKVLLGHSKYFFRGGIADSFSAPDSAFEKARFRLKSDAEGHRENSTLISFMGMRLKAEPKGDQLTFELDNPDDKQMHAGYLVRRLERLIYKRMLESLPTAFILSAERFGISLFYKELDFTKNRLVEELQRLSDKKSPSERRVDFFRLIDKESARYAKPIKDNIDFTRDLPEIQKQRSEIPRDKMRSVENMMEARYVVKNNEIRFISKRRGAKRFDVPLHLASSSASGVSDLYFYLKHKAQLGEILMIDEPESHLSPTSQVLMARLLVFCVNAGLKVLITTHSDYLIKEINNLIMLNGKFKGKKEFLRNHKKDYTENDYLKPESVKAYICEDGTLEKCKINAQGIDMRVFDEAIDTINQISNELGWLKADVDEERHD